MIKRISMLLAQKIVLENNEKDNEDIYAYGLEIIINSLISIISVLAIGILQHNFWYTVIYLTTYCSIRLYAGGYHAKNNFYCILIFVLAYMCSPIWNVLYCKFVTAFITLCIINLVVISWAPVDSLQNPILDSERLLLKKKAIGLTVIVSVLILCNVILRFSSHISGASAALTYIGIVVAVGKLKDQEEEMKNWKKSLFKMMGKMSMFVAVYTVALGYPHCLIILHQPQVPEKLKKMREG